MEPVESDHLDILVTILSAPEPTAKRFIGTPEQVLRGIIAYARSYDDSENGPVEREQPARNGQVKHAPQSAEPSEPGPATIEDRLGAEPSGAQLVHTLLTAIKGKQADAARSLVEAFGPGTDKELFSSTTTAEVYLSALKHDDYLAKGLHTELQAKRLLALVATARLAKEHPLYRPTLSLAAERLGLSFNGSAHPPAGEDATRGSGERRPPAGPAEPAEGLEYSTEPSDRNDRITRGVQAYLRKHDGAHAAADHLYALAQQSGQGHTYTLPALLVRDLSDAARGIFTPSLLRLLPADPAIRATTAFADDLAERARAITEQTAR